MNKEIEEMAKVIDDRLVEARGYLGSMNRGEGYWIAQKLVEHYQPKLPEDSVVLTREEYEELKQAKTLLEFREETIKYLEDANIRYAEALELKVSEKERKETAREDLGKSKARFYRA